MGCGGSKPNAVTPRAPQYHVQEQHQYPPQYAVQPMKGAPQYYQQQPPVVYPQQQQNYYAPQPQYAQQ